MELTTKREELKMYCAICGDDKKLSAPFRFWSPDDGWQFGKMCPYCKKSCGKTRPKKTDFAFDLKAESGDIDQYIDAFHG